MATRTKSLKVHLTEEEYSLLSRLASQESLPMGATLRRLLSVYHECVVCERVHNGNLVCSACLQTARDSVQQEIDSGEMQRKFYEMVRRGNNGNPSR